MKPSYLQLEALIPLRGTFYSDDQNLAAAILVAALAKGPDEWGSASPAQLSESAARFESYLRPRGYSPSFGIFRPLFKTLVEDGFAYIHRDDRGVVLGVGFLPVGIKELERSPWRRSPTQKDLF